jgi:hypothetical protein
LALPLFPLMSLEPESWVSFGHFWLSQRNSWPLLSLVYLSPFPAKNEDIASVIGNQVFVHDHGIATHTTAMQAVRGLID